MINKRQKFFILMMIIVLIDGIVTAEEQINNNTADMVNKTNSLGKLSPTTDSNDHLYHRSSLRHRFEFVSNFKPIRTNFDNTNITHIIMPNNLQQHFEMAEQQNYHHTPTTFRPSSSILYLHPPKPPHIESIKSILTTLNLTETEIMIGWKLIVYLRNNYNDNHQLSSTKERVRRKVEQARVEQEQNPVHYNIYLRRYGHSDREKYTIIDRNNTLDPPITTNQTYNYKIVQLEQMNAYEFCLQSINAGEIVESDEIRRQFPVNALNEMVGRNNPLFLCKEIVLPPPPLPTDRFTNQTKSNFLEKFIGRSSIKNDKQPKLQSRSSSVIELNDEATDAFVLYTAISSGSTTVIIFLLILVFCCCRCKRRKETAQSHHPTALFYDPINPYLDGAASIVPYNQN